MANNEIKILVTATGAEQAAKVLADVAKSGAQLGGLTASGAKQAEAALTSLGATGTRVFEIFTGFTAANLFSQAIASVKAFTTEVAKLGLEAKVQEDAFARLSKSVGVSGDALVAQMNQAAGGILNTSDVMIAAAKALNQSLQPEQIVKLMEIARQQSKLAGIDVSEAFNQITNAIANQQPRALKQLGIVVDMDAAFKKHAATLGVEVEQLSELGKTQATYNAVAEQTKNSVAALTGEALTQSEQIQKMSGAWKQVKEDLGKFVVDTGFAILAWFEDVGKRIPDLTAATQQMGAIWSGVWENLKLALAGIGENLVSVIIPSLKIALAAASAFGVGLNAAFAATAGPAAFLSNVIGDLADKKWPDFKRATLEANVATAEARVRLAESIEGFQGLAAGTAAAGTATKDLAASTAMGTNALAGMAGQTKALVPDLKALAAEAEKVAEAILKSHVAAAEAAVAETERELAMELEITNKRLADEAKLLEQGTAGWVAHAEAIEQNDLAGLAAELALTNERLAEEKKALDDTNAGWVAHAEAVFAATEQELNAIAKVNAPLRAYQDTLDEIALKGKLFGSSFDTLAPTISAVTAEIVRLGAAGQDVTALQEKLAGLKQAQELKGIFSDVFSSIGSAINTSIQGIILGTTTMAKAWDNLWKSIVLSFVNSGVQRLLKGLTDWLWDFLSGTSSGGFGGGSGGGIFGAILSGAGALVAKLAGSGASGIGPGTGTDPTGAFENVTNAANKTASALNLANPAVSNFAAGVSVAVSALGVGAGIYGLTKGGSPASMAFSAAGTAASVYSLAVSASQLAVNAGLIGTALPTIGVLLAQGLATVAPSIAAAVGTAIYTAFGSSAVTTALLGGGAVAAGGGAVAGGGIGAALGASAGASFLGFAAFMVAGGFAGMAADAEDAAESFNEQLGAVQEALNRAGAAGLLFANLGKNLTESRLVESLEQLHSALRALGDLDLAVGLNQVIGDASAQGITAQIPKLRATVGAAWLAAMDAATAKGQPIPIRSPGRDLTAPWAGAVGMQSFEDMLAQSAGAGRDGFDKLTHLMEHISQSLDENLYKVNASGVRMVDLGAVNALLDKEFLTTSLRNAVVDIGALFGISAGQLGGIGAGEGNWRGTPWAGDMPSMAAIASAQSALEAAGFTPGKYAEALETYLLSIDANLVNNPAWKKFIDMLHGAGGDSGVLAAIKAIDRFGKDLTSMEFYQTGRGATEGLTARLKERLQARASETDTDALKVIDESIQAMTETIKAWSSLVTLYTGLPVEMAAIAGDLEQQTGASIDAWRVQMQSFTDAIADSRKALDETIGGGNLVAIASAAQAVHDQTIAQYNAVTKAVESIHAAINGLLESAGVLVETMTSVAQFDIRSGSTATLTSLLGSLQDIAEHGGTAAIRLFAINQAIGAIIATLPATIEQFGAAGGAGGITAGVGRAAAPFLAAQQGAIDQAQGAAQLALLQQQAQTLNALASAVIAGIQQALQGALKAAREAADADIAGITRTRDEQLKAVDTEIAGIEQEAARRHELHAAEIEAIQGVAKEYHDKAMAEIEAIETTAKAAHESRMAEIDAIQEAEDAARELRAAEIDALSELINKAKELESAVEGMGKFIDALKKGPLGPGNPADKAALAQDSFAKALAAFNANPTAGGLTDLQDLAQTMLAQQEKVLSKPSPAFQTLSATTIKQLLAAQALAAAQMTDSQVLKAQLEQLQAIDKAAAKDARDQIKAIQDADEAAGKNADAMIAAIKKRDEGEQAQAAALIKGIDDLDKSEQAQAKALIDKLNDVREKIDADFARAQTAIEVALKAQLLAIEKAAGDEIDHVQKGTAAALQANMQVQIPLLAAQFDAANAQLAAIGETSVWQRNTLDKLEELRRLLAAAIPAATGIERVTEGLYHLHDDEMVIPKGMADKIRSAQEGAGLPHASKGEEWRNKFFQPRDLGLESKVWTGPAADALNDLERRILLLQTQYDATVAHNEYKSGGKSYKHYTAAQLSAQKAEMEAQIAALRTQQQTLLAAVPKTTVPPPGPPPPGTPPPPTVPYSPPGPPWLNRPKESATTMGAFTGEYGGGGGASPVTVIVKLDGKTIGTATLPTIQADARAGKMRTIILETR